MPPVFVSPDGQPFHAPPSGVKGFLFDENLPRRVLFVPSHPVLHVEMLGRSPDDAALWECARNEEFVIVTKDADFSHRILLSHPPPWVVHLRFGNVRRADFHAFPARVWPQIEALLPAYKLVNVYADRIEAVS